MAELLLLCDQIGAEHVEWALMLPLWIDSLLVAGIAGDVVAQCSLLVSRIATYVIADAAMDDAEGMLPLTRALGSDRTRPISKKQGSELYAS